MGGPRKRRSAWARTALALGVTTLLAAGSVLAGMGTALTGLLGTGPLLAATAGLGPLPTALVAAYALALALAADAPQGTFGTRGHLIRCATVGTTAVFSTALAVRNRRRERALARIQRVAEVAQLAILQPVPARLGGVALAARYLSASQEALIGGDFYAAERTPAGVRLLVGDVKGKGLDGVRLAASVLGGFRQAAVLEDDLAEVASALDRAIASQLGEEDFVTAVLVEFGSDGKLRVVNCGHPPPLLLRQGVAIPLADQPATPLGMHPVPAVERVLLEPSDRLLVYTDGLVEARSPDGRWFPLAAQARLLLAARSLDSALDGLVNRLLDHAGGDLRDDLALLLAQPRPAGTAARQRAAARRAPR